jgi:hypothetical protein
MKAQQPEQPLAYWVVLPTDFVDEQQQEDSAAASGELRVAVQVS